MNQKIWNILFIVILFVLSIFLDVDEKPKLIKNNEKSESLELFKPEPVLVKNYNLDLPKEGKVQNLSNMKYSRIKSLKYLDKKFQYGYSMASHDSLEYTFVKPSTGNQMYFVNAYLNGFVPYEVENIWVTLSYLQTRLKYQLDEKAYKGREEVWQTPKQSYKRLRGDCEDHAILLADWLIGLGYEARVVSGTVKVRGSLPQGHAWVILYRDGKEYLLEATQKSKWNQLPLASKFPNYFPNYMFDRKNLWVHTGTKFTSKYSGSQWKLNGKFIPYNAYYKDLEG